METFLVIIGIWVLGWLLSVPLSIYVIFSLDSYLPKDKMDYYIPTFVILGMFFTWLLVLADMIFVFYDIFSDFKKAYKKKKLYA